MQELPNSTETNCHQVPQAGADTKQTVQEPTQAEVTESTATNGTNVANGATANVKPKKKRANPVYITKVRQEKRYNSDSDNDGDSDGDWAPGKKRSKSGKKKAKSRKAKSPKL